MKHHRSLKAAVCLLLCLLPALFAARPAFAFAPDGETRRGIDISQWQGEINFDLVAHAGVEIIYIRAGLGAEYVDPEFYSNAELAKKAGLPFGCYHFVTARSVEEAVEQARFFADTIKDTGYSCRPAMDFESFGSLSTAEINAVANAYLQELEAQLSVLPIIYSDAYDARSIWASSLSKYPLWVADYGVSEPAENGKWDTWVGFQYSDTGRVDGINGDVDLDWFTPGVFLPQTPPASSAPAVSSAAPISLPPASVLGSSSPASSLPASAASTSLESSSFPAAESLPPSSHAASSTANSVQPGGTPPTGLWYPVLIFLAAALVCFLAFLAFEHCRRDEQ